ncbi:MAG TPA: diacylglycerol kinase family protein [Gaiellaceae bacterium]|nr:diacylglycerol kinase family protein [Gaiellaceae bacterium]
MKVALVVNPFATRVSEERLAAVRAELERVAELDVVLTERPGHATELVTGACRGGVEALVVFSGDGGFNEALNGLETDVPIGFLPGGGTSVLSRALGLSQDPAEAARAVAGALSAGRTRRITVGRVNGRRFAFGAGVGLDAEAVRRVDALGRREDGKRPGDLAFAVAIVRALAAQRGHVEPQLEIAGLGRAALVFVANGSPYTYAKGVPVPIAREARFELGLDLVAPIRVRRRTLVGTAVRILTGHVRHGPYLYGHDLDRVELVCDRPMPLHADGEDLGDVERAVFEAERAAVSVLV